MAFLRNRSDILNDRFWGRFWEEPIGIITALLKRGGIRFMFLVIEESKWADRLQRAGAGDMSALAILYDETSVPVFSLILRITQKSEVLFFIQFHFDKGTSTREDPAVYAHSPFR